ncbi:MAG TPA: phage holin family protein [Gemmatimonadaceae bacterium]|nr:phage holin family protein [Gemmatimonadaceae bacterium]
MSARADGRRGLGDLLRDLADGSGRLVRQEVGLARLEVQELLGQIGAGTAQAATGAVLLLIGAMALLTGIILLVGDAWLRDRYWLAALIVTVVLGIVAAWLGGRGVALLSPARLKPAQTVETLREDKEWLKRRLTSGVTSS